MNALNDRDFRAFQRKDLPELAGKAGMKAEQVKELLAVSAVFPFRVNRHVVTLINWQDVPNDPIYRLTFPHRDMLSPEELDRLLGLMGSDGTSEAFRAEVRKIQLSLNPHPAGQLELNVPSLEGVPVPGLQHKYRETVLVFPSQGQTCHAYCSYCFRWPQFVGIDGLKQATRDASQLIEYLRRHPEVTSLLFTGGDPLVMRTTVIERYVDAILAANLDQLTSIRFGTKSLTYWPRRFTRDDDADALLGVFGRIVDAGKHLAIMAHVSHPRELEPLETVEAIRRVRATGAVIRCQAPIIRHVNDDATTWADMWRRQVQLGLVPYYMFIARDTGPRHYFEVSLARALNVFTQAYSEVSGLARTVRGPSMSTTPGKVVVDGILELDGQKTFALKFTQARDPSWLGRPFLARYDPCASWLDHLTPVDGGKFFFEPGFEAFKSQKSASEPAIPWSKPLPRKLWGPSGELRGTWIPA